MQTIGGRKIRAIMFWSAAQMVSIPEFGEYFRIGPGVGKSIFSCPLFVVMYVDKDSRQESDV